MHHYTSLRRNFGSGREYGLGEFHRVRHFFQLSSLAEADVARSLGASSSAAAQLKGGGLMRVEIPRAGGNHNVPERASLIALPSAEAIHTVQTFLGSNIPDVLARKYAHIHTEFVGLFLQESIFSFPNHTRSH